MPVMDATPLRIKERAFGGQQRSIVTHRPRTFNELVMVVQQLAVDGRPYTVVGARSNVVGALDTDSEVVLSTELLTGVREFDGVSNIVRVGAGTLGGWLESWLAERDRTIGQFPQSLHISTVGGWLSTRACGSWSALYGGVERALLGARVVTAAGAVLEFGPRVRPLGGLDGLAALIGSEGSLGVVGEVTFHVHHRLPENRMCFLLPDLAAVIDAQRQLVQGGYPVAVLRGHNVAETAHILADESVEECLLIVTSSGPPELTDAHRGAIGDALVGLGARQLPDDSAARWFEERYAVSTMMEDRNREPGSAFDTIEVSVPWSTAAACADELEARLGPVVDRYYLHFSHPYQAGVCFYSLLWLSAHDDLAVVGKLRDAWKQVLDIVERYGGTVGHHHGVGAVRAERYGHTADAEIHRALKQALDPRGLLTARLLGSEA
ncbi:MAG: FAD-binding protein [Streptosporangiales bacterium]|nr:FAD-binding protein [Streptosporangiales bacterium]